MGSTTVGENLILQALGIPGTPGRIVTDDLHFIGSSPMYSELAKRGTRPQSVIRPIVPDPRPCSLTQLFSQLRTFLILGLPADQAWPVGE